MSQPASPEECRYRVHLMPDAEPTDHGIAYRRGESSSVLEWSSVSQAVAAGLGEPDGVWTIVFDLVIESDGATCVAYRCDADPFENATELARAIEGALGPERTAPSIKSIAADGSPSRWYPDLESFEEAILEALGQ